MNLLKKRTNLLFAAVMLLTGYASSTHALYLIPTRCEHDNLNLAQAIGRNQWLKKCDPLAYRAYFPTGSEVYKPYGAGYLLYPTYAKVNESNEKGQILYERTEWKAPTVAPANQEDPSCQIPDQIEPIGLCLGPYKGE